jgi:hypothetical protein
MKTHAKEAAKIAREHKHFVSPAPRKIHDGRNERPSLVIRTISQCVPDTPLEPTQGVGYDETVQIKQTGMSDDNSVLSSVSEGDLDYTPVMKLDTDFDVGLGTRYDAYLLDRINANWDEELRSEVPFPTVSTVAEDPAELFHETVGYEDAQLFHHAHKSLGKYLLAAGHL